MTYDDRTKRLDARKLQTIPEITEPYRSRVILTLAPEDGMYVGDDRHYLSCGASALNAIICNLRLANAPNPSTILDFGAGAGRVTRWIRAAFPAAEIYACDVRADDMEFCAKAFRAKTWISGNDIDALVAPGKYDLIWVGSVATHLSGDNTRRLLQKLISWAKPGGLLVMSLHGRQALAIRASGQHSYDVDDEAWEQIKSGYATSGYGYADYRGTSGYGISVTKLSWAATVIEQRSSIRLVSLSERAWDDHHDVLAVQVV